MPDQSPAYASHVYGGTAYTELDAGYDTRGVAPWHLSGIRIDGLSAASTLSPVTPGAQRTYTCTFRPRADAPQDHIDRYKRARAYLVRAPDVLIIDSPGAGVYFRERYQGGLSALARLEPLRADHDGSYASGDPPPGRDSIHTGRWVAVTGPTDAGPVPLSKTAITLTLEATTLGATEDPGPESSAPAYTTRDEAIAAFERNGLTQYSTHSKWF